MIKAAFLDRDGTLNADFGYVHTKEQFRILPGVFEALQALQAQGFALIVITNQSGIARGYYSEQDYLELNRYMFQLFEEHGIRILASYYCPHHPEGKIPSYKKSCNCRKPATGLFYQAVRDFDIDLDKSIAIGDNLRDLRICNASGCRGFWIHSEDSSEYDKQKILRIESIAQIPDEVIKFSEAKNEN